MNGSRIFVCLMAIETRIFSANLRPVAIMHQCEQPVKEVELGQNRPDRLTISFLVSAIYENAAMPLSLIGHQNNQILIDLIAL